MTTIFGAEIEFNVDKFKLPKGASDKQLIEFAEFIGYTPVVLQELKLEV